jgi:hypothetical protein
MSIRFWLKNQVWQTSSCTLPLKLYSIFEVSLVNSNIGKLYVITFNLNVVYGIVCLCVVFARSRFIENPPIWSWEINPLFLRCFCHTQTHQNALRDLQIAPNAKTQVQHNMSQRASYGTCTGTAQAWKLVVDISRLGQTRKHYVIHRLHQMQNHNFSVACSNTLYMGSALGPPEQEKIVHRCFTPRTHYNTLYDLQIAQGAKSQIQCNVF